MTLLSRLTRAAPFVLIAAAFAAGIALDSAWPVHPWVLALVLAAAALACARALRAKARDMAWIWALALLAGLGALRHAISAPRADDALAARLAGQVVVVDAVVDDEPLERPSMTTLRLRARRLADQHGALLSDSFVFLARVPPDMDGARRWRYGDLIRLEGELARPPRIDAFDYRLYLARQGVFLWLPRTERAQWLGYAPGNVVWARMLAAKDAARQAIRAAMPLPESALLNGILIGDDNEMPESTQEAFRRTGTSHIISISGFNVSVVVGMVLLLIGRFTHPRRVAPALLALLWVYALFVGASASVVRAVVMTSIALTGQLLWRRGFTLNTLCAAGFFLMLASPFYLFDVGFQLSFAATLGLVLFADRLSQPVVDRFLTWRRFAWLNKLARLLADGVLLTSAAQLTTLPLIALHYGQLSLITLLTNGAILPLQPPIMALGMLTAGAGAVSRDLGAWVGIPVYALLHASIWVVEATSAADWAAVPVPGAAAPSAWAYYLALLVGGLVLAQPPLVRRALGQWLRTRAAAGLALGLAAALLAGAVALSTYANDGRARLSLGGSSAVLWLPDGRNVVLLGDGDVEALLATRLPPWRRTIDVLVVARLDARTAERGAKLLQSHGADAIVLPPAAVPTDTVFSAWRALGGQPIADLAMAELAAGVSAPALQPDELGNGQLGLRITCGRQRIDVLGRADAPETYVFGDVVILRASRHNVDALAGAQPRLLDLIIWNQPTREAANAAAQISARRALNLDEHGNLAWVCADEHLQLLGL